MPEGRDGYVISIWADTSVCPYGAGKHHPGGVRPFSPFLNFNFLPLKFC